MDRKKFLIRSVSLIFIIFLLNYLAMTFYWYSSIWYFDMPMHFLGGIWLGLVSLYLFSLKDFSFKSFLKIFLVVLLVGIGWEVFEVLVNRIITHDLFNLLEKSTKHTFFLIDLFRKNY